jgi:hypothetical protein
MDDAAGGLGSDTPVSHSETRPSGFRPSRVGCASARWSLAVTGHGGDCRKCRKQDHLLTETEIV